MGRVKKNILRNQMKSKEKVAVGQDAKTMETLELPGSLVESKPEMS